MPCKNGDNGGGSLISLDGVSPSQTVDVSASVIFPCPEDFFSHRLTQVVPEKEP